MPDESQADHRGRQAQRAEKTLVCPWHAPGISLDHCVRPGGLVEALLAGTCRPWIRVLDIESWLAVQGPSQAQGSRAVLSSTAQDIPMASPPSPRGMRGIAVPGCGQRSVSAEVSAHAGDWTGRS